MSNETKKIEELLPENLTELVKNKPELAVKLILNLQKQIKELKEKIKVERE